MRWTAALVAAAAVMLAGPADARQATRGHVDIPPPPAATEAALPTAAPAPELTRQLERLQEFRQVKPDGTVGLAVFDATGQRLASRNADAPMMPASTMKLVTAAAALRMFGPDHRFVTRVHATRSPDASGVIHGDLLVAGGGDPVLATPRFVRRVNSERPATDLRLLAERIAAAGVTRVTGHVVGDPSILADEPLAAGWGQTYLRGLDTSRSSGLTVDAGVRLFRRSGTLHAEAAADPAVRAAGQLRALLRDRGVRVDRPPRRGRGGPPGVEITRVSSPPLSELLTHMVRTSDNHLADGIFRMLGAAIGDPTWAGSARAARRTLADIGADWTGLRLADGSGLSRHNRLSADTIVRLLHAMGRDPARDSWLSLLAVAGENGTMRRRLTGTPAAGRVLAKTGTLRDVRTLAGTVPGRDGQEHHFVVLANDLSAYADVAAARRLADVLALALVVAQDGCAEPIAVTDPTESRSPEAMICGTRQGGDSKK